MSTKGEQWYKNRLKSSYWNKVRELVLLKNDYACSARRCSHRKNLDFHHLSYDRLGTIYEVDDIVLLCRKHYDKAHHRGKKKIPNTKEELNKRYNEVKQGSIWDIHPSEVFEFLGKLWK